MGIYAFLVGIVSLFLAWILGRKRGVDETTTKIKGEVTIQQSKADKSEKESTLMETAAKEVLSMKTQNLSDVSAEIDEARRQGDWDKAKEIAMKMAAHAREISER